jgi:hypothetical protein
MIKLTATCQKDGSSYRIMQLSLSSQPQRKGSGEEKKMRASFSVARVREILERQGGGRKAFTIERNPKL